MNTARKTSTILTLDGPHLQAARGAWVAATVLTVLLFFVTLPVHVRETATITADPTASFYRLYPEDALTLARYGITPMGYAVYLNIINTGFMLACLALGVFIFWQRSDDWIVILVSLAIILFGATFVQSIHTLAVRNPSWRLPIDFHKAVATVVSVYFFLVFPDGRFVPRWLLIPSVIWTAWMLVSPFFPAINPMLWDNWVWVLMSWYIVGLLAQFYRFQRVSGSTQRQQTRWIVYSISAAIIGVTLYNIFPMIFPQLAQPGSRALYNLVAVPLFAYLPISLLPIGLGVSITRYRLWSLNIFIGRSLGYGVITAVLGLIYFASVLGLQRLFAAVTGVEQSDLAVAASTLVIALTFMPVRRRVERALTRRIAPQEQSTVLLRRDEVARLRLSAYEILEQLSKTGMSEVYKARQVSLDRLVAIKVLPPSLATDLDFRTRFEREAHLVANLRHPNIVQVFDFGQTEDGFFMAMEFLEGEDLRAHLRKRGRLRPDEAGYILRELANALDYAHQRGIIHRDVKPSNVMLRPFRVPENDHLYRPILMDFGIAKIMGDNSLTHSGVVGTLDYMAPEQVSSGEIDGRADVYALGVLLFQMLTGSLPFPRSSPAQVLFAHLNDMPPHPSELVPEISEEVAFVVLRALAKLADERYASPNDFATAYELAAQITTA